MSKKGRLLKEKVNAQKHFEYSKTQITYVHLVKKVFMRWQTKIQLFLSMLVDMVSSFAQEEEKEREEKDAAVAAGEDAMNANQSPESEYDRDREVMQRCVKLILQGRPQIMMPLAPKV